MQQRVDVTLIMCIAAAAYRLGFLVYLFVS